MSRKRYAIALAALTIVALVRVASTHRVFSEVLDEPAHLSAGMEWLHGRYVLDASHPPLARILGALPLWLAGYPLPEKGDMVVAGNEILYHGNRYVKTLARMRSGNLPLLALAIVATAAWARRTFGTGVALMSAALLGSIPPVLGHAGVLTTDLAALATLTLALLTLDRFLVQPSMRDALLLGVAIGLGALAKFSFLVFFPACAVLLVVARWRVRPRLRELAIIAVTAFVVAWGGYRFDLGTLRRDFGDFATYIAHVSVPEPLRPQAIRLAEKVPLPAPAFIVGVAILQKHNEGGHTAYLLGELKNTGWWYYFPVVFYYKTPLPFLILAAFGTLLVLRGRDRVGIAILLCALAVMAISMTSRINIGVRHVLPLYAPLAIVAAYGAVELWKRFSRIVATALLGWMFVGAALAHPDYLAWFNEAAGRSPWRIAVDSNLDWGQDVLRLERAVRELHVDSLQVDVMTNARFDSFGIPVAGFDSRVQPHGWVAISETPLAFGRELGAYEWLQQQRPIRRVGKSIRLYWFP